MYYFTAVVLTIHFLYFIRKTMRFYFSMINSKHPNIRFAKEKEIDQKVPFLDVLNHNDTHFPVIGVYRKKTFTGLLTNYFSSIPHPYKLGLIRTLVDRAYKINNTWLGFHEDIKKLTEILQKNLFPAHLVERVVNRYLTLARNECNPSVSVSDTTTTFYFKLPYIGPFSVVSQKRVRQFAKRHCDNIDIYLGFFHLLIYIKCLV